jgi:predicted house-cleaning NTP pyrophosphatase (Maf/HAM1 superfamily)
MMRLILASASPRRAELLTAAGYSFETCAVDIDEHVRQGELPADYVRRLAQAKSAAAAGSLLRLEGAAGSLHATSAAPRQGYGGLPKFAAEGAGGSPTLESSDGMSCVGSSFNRTDAVVLAADTSVVVDDRIFGKPRDDEEAAAMIRQLAGRAHQVLTGMSLRHASREMGGVESTAVWFTALTAEDVEWYIASGEGRGKAGAYAIQGLASRFIPRIEGSYSNVVGLPIATVHALIRQMTT